MVKIISVWGQELRLDEFFQDITVLKKTKKQSELMESIG